MPAVVTKIQHFTVSAEGTRSRRGDLLFPKSDVTPNGLARVSSLDIDDVLIGSDVIIGRVKESSSINSSFLSYQINSDKKQLLRLVKGTTVRHMSENDLSTAAYRFPSKEEQQDVAGFFRVLDSLIAAHERKRELLEKSEQAYLQKLFV
jgi:type I restriction enzyme S subunit